MTPRQDCRGQPADAPQPGALGNWPDHQPDDAPADAGLLEDVDRIERRLRYVAGGIGGAVSRDDALAALARLRALAAALARITPAHVDAVREATDHLSVEITPQRGMAAAADEVERLGALVDETVEVLAEITATKGDA